MIIELNDKQLISDIEPNVIGRYLLAKGWQFFKQLPNDVALWDYVDQGIQERIWLPLNQSFGDFSEAMGRVITTISEVEKRSIFDVIHDIESQTVGDVLRLKTYDVFDRSNHSIPFLQGRDLIDQIYHLALAGATAVFDSGHAVLSSFHTIEAREYIQRLRLGQTERGSYQITLISPIVHPSSWEQLMFPIHDYPIIPFERKAMVQLIKGLDALVFTATKTTKAGYFQREAFADIVSEGVNADLCEAVLPRRKNIIIAPIEISVSWSYAVKAPLEPTKTIVITPELIHHINLAAQYYREEQPRLVTIRGPITLLRRPKVTAAGVIRMQTLIEGITYRSVQIKIADPVDYNLATEAHRLGDDLECTGTLTKRKDRYYLNFVRDIRIVQR